MRNDILTMIAALTVLAGACSRPETESAALASLSGEPIWHVTSASLFASVKAATANPPPMKFSFMTLYTKLIKSIDNTPVDIDGHIRRHPLDTLKANKAFFVSLDQHYGSVDDMIKDATPYVSDLLASEANYQKAVYAAADLDSHSSSSLALVAAPSPSPSLALDDKIILRDNTTNLTPCATFQKTWEGCRSNFATSSTTFASTYANANPTTQEAKWNQLVTVATTCYQNDLDYQWAGAAGGTTGGNYYFGDGVTKVPDCTSGKPSVNVGQQMPGSAGTTAVTPGPSGF